MIESLILALMGLIFPRADVWVMRTVASLGSAIAEVLAEARKLKIPFAKLILHVRTVLDKGLDEIPGWGTLLSEEDRDTVLDAGVILAGLIYKVSKKGDGDVTQTQIRRSIRNAKKVMVDEIRRIPELDAPVGRVRPSKLRPVAERPGA